MEIKRKFELTVTTNRRYVIRQAPSAEAMKCLVCSQAMLKAEDSASLFGITQRRLFQSIETGAVHYAEAGAAMICITSLAEFLNDEINTEEEINES